MRLNKTLKRLAIGGSLLTTTAAGIYSVPMVLNPATRGLNAKEIALAKQIFGNQLNYEKITLHQGTKGIFTPGMDDEGAGGVTWGNDIFINEKIDSSEKLEDIPANTLMHELTHSLQFQKGEMLQQLAQTFNPISFLKDNHGDYKDLYSSHDEKSYSVSNYERQAEVVGFLAEDMVEFHSAMDSLAVRDQKPEQLERNELYVTDYYTSLKEGAAFIKDALPLPGMKAIEDNVSDIKFQFIDNAQALLETRLMFGAPLARSASLKK